MPETGTLAPIQNAMQNETQNDLFKDSSTDASLERIDHDLGNAAIQEFPQFISAADADRLLEQFLQEIPWNQESIRIAGKVISVPRLQCWMGDRQSVYGYSGIRMEPVLWHQGVLKVRRQINAEMGLDFNSVLLNYYRDGKDSVSWHADDEKELGAKPVIASLSLGAVREFQLKPKSGSASKKRQIMLGHGSLLIMGDTLQRHWQHQIPKTKSTIGPRINLTFRHIL